MHPLDSPPARPGLATRRGLLGIGVGAVAASGIARRARAAGYPERPIELIVPWGPGGGADQLGRKVAQLWEPLLKVSLPVVNVPGASGVTGLSKMLAAPADGYSVSVITGDTIGLQATGKPGWRLEDVAPLGVLIQQTSLFLVGGGSPYKSWAEVERAARTRELKVAITGFGTSDDQTVSHYRKEGLKLTAVPFAKPGERYAAVVGGNADLLYEQAGDVRGFLEGGQLRPVLHLATTRGDFPDVPTAAETGGGPTLKAYRGIVARADTDPGIVRTLTETLAEVARSAEFRAYLKDQYAAPDSVVLGAEASRFIAAELAATRQLASL
jgi:tripartite-type tricarboxylate transporter receptor subunit TctC